MKNRHEKFKLAMKITGLILLIGGIAFIIVGAVDFFIATSQWRQPEKFWAFFVGFPLFAFGLPMTLTGFHREIARYMKDEMSPVINEAAKDISPAVEATAKAAAAGVKKGLEQSATNGKDEESAETKE
ncbi:MAG: hypothetical protein SPH68_00055 [Candidatus Borkfalkiaceae bacterium]|nr:hypothetical protein [Clostridia bacterium]MDY6222540.1 hypothetical protein [Christensenellaceae bacterium]